MVENIYAFSYSKMVSFTVDPEAILEIQTVRQKYTLDGTPVHCTAQ